MLRSSRSFGNPLFRRLHRHQNMTALFRSFDYSLPQPSFSGERVLPTAPVVIATLPQEVVPESTFTQEFTGVPGEIPTVAPMSQVAAPRLPPARPVEVKPAGAAVPVPPPQPRTAVQPAVQRQAQPTARTAQPSRQPAAQSPSVPAQPIPVLPGAPSEVSAKDDKGEDPIWRRLQTIFRKHDEKRVQETQAPSEIEASPGEVAIPEKKVSGEASIPKERTVDTERQPVGLQRKVVSPPLREAPVQRQVQVEEIGTSSAPVSTDRRHGAADQQSAIRPQGVQPSENAVLPASREMPVPPAQAKPATVERREEEQKPVQPSIEQLPPPPPVLEAVGPPAVQRTPIETLPEKPAVVQDQQVQRKPEVIPASEKEVAVEIPTQITTSVTRRTPTPGAQAQEVEPASSAVPPVVETGSGVIQRSSDIPSARPLSVEQTSGQVEMTEAQPDQIKVEKQAQPSEVSLEDFPTVIQRVPASPEAPSGETRPSSVETASQRVVESPSYMEDLIAADEEETVIQSPLRESPLEAVWPVQIVQRSTPAEPAQPKPVEPAKIKPPQFLEEADGEPVYDTLKNVLPGQPTDSPLELIRPRKPRPAPIQLQETAAAPVPTGVTDLEPTGEAVSSQPTVQAKPDRERPTVVEAVPAAEPPQVVQMKPDLRQPPVVGRVQALEQPTRAPQMPAVQPPVVQPGVEMVPTAIGPLPSDLWTLIDQVPEAAPPVSPAASPVARDVIPAQREETVHQTATPIPGSTSPVVQRQVAGEIPTSRAPAGMVVQLVEAPTDTEGPPEQAPAEEAQPAGGEVNIDELALRVYGEVKRRLSIEWERLRRKF